MQVERAVRDLIAAAKEVLNEFDRTGALDAVALHFPNATCRGGLRYEQALKRVDAARNNLRMHIQIVEGILND